MIIHHKKQTKLLNVLLDLQLNDDVVLKETPSFKRRIYALTLLLIAYYCTVPALMRVINGLGTTLEYYLYLILLYCLVGQYYLGHVFEFVLFECLTNYFEQLLSQMKYHCGEWKVLREVITVQSDLWEISGKFIKLYELNKIICLTLKTVLVSIYWFYSYDFTRLNLLPPIIWQGLVSILFLTCHTWHRLTMQVSDTSIN